MPNTVAKLYREPNDAIMAINELQGKGCKADEIGILLRDSTDAKNVVAAVKGANVSNITLPQSGSSIAAGPVAKSLSGAGEDITEAISQTLEINEDASKYYQFGISVNGVVVSVHTDEARSNEARQILRKIEAPIEKDATAANHPGFGKASRMSATDPVDAAMSGDFRKY